MERIDVAVVGGGPAGAAAARAAAERDASVVLFEKGVPRADRDGPGPDSTDAAGILDYWVDIMELSPEEFPDGVLLRELEGAEFVGPTEAVSLRSTGIESSYPHFGYTYDRARFDDWMLDRARAAGAETRVGVGVDDVTTRRVDGTPVHDIELKTGESLEADALVLADGPQRTVTLGVLDQFLPAEKAPDTVLDSTRVNHIAYQEYRRFPEEAFDPTTIKFWWGHMPGHTAYPWVFPNDGTVARVGLTMPIGLELEGVEDRDAYKLLRADDPRLPSADEYIRRLLEQEYGDEYDIEEDFPRVTDRGKRNGTETYPISSTYPIESPVRANVAVTGGAMGATSAFHEGGGHVAVRTGKIAGRLAGEGRLEAYNETWKRAIGDEVLRNVAMADLVRDFGPADWDDAFRVANRLLEMGADGIRVLEGAYAAGITGLKLAAAYRWHKYRYRDGGYVQLAAEDYAY